MKDPVYVAHGSFVASPTNLGCESSETFLAAGDYHHVLPLDDIEFQFYHYDDNLPATIIMYYPILKLDGSEISVAGNLWRP